MTVSPYDGRHLIADLEDGSNLADPVLVEACLVAATAAAGATLLEVRLHHFGAGQGVTGVALLAESHISIHTWPEHGYAAVDIFMCGKAHRLEAALDVIAEAFGARVSSCTVLPRGFGQTVAAGG
ncbi:MAG: adenosylmethionine decarboxylase [Pseudomonadota bacterium]